ncbi:LacI family DNA-binding transcriptional regulator [Thiospirochaeta perfilievii]|uniref:LacI family DNA-binding transcriptional regulator n=1 Tax=Thiospirochaeta perfilievii TaxID=252967 RepID=A0A5C1Q5U8_9SPIO|nr:LacI family DNA-binding transcriptional regulator [Thiospirochaeta perfilievii]
MATIKEIADAAGVSVGTVDRILHNRGRFSAETAKKVQILVSEMGYSLTCMLEDLKNHPSTHFL